MRGAGRYRSFAPIVISLVLVLSFSAGGLSGADAHVAPLLVTTTSVNAAPSATASPAATPGSAELQSAVTSLEHGAGPAAGLAWSCDAHGVSASCGPGSPGAQPVRASDDGAAASVHPSYRSYANYSDLNWTNQSGLMGTDFSVDGNGVASYDPNLQAVILFGGSAHPQDDCYWGGGCAGNFTWEYRNGTWTNISADYDYAGGAPPVTYGATLTWDPEWDGSILTGGTQGAFGIFPSPYTWLFDGFWYNISATVGPGPDTIFGSAAYDSYYDGLVYVNGCDYLFCNQTNVQGITDILYGSWDNVTSLVGGPDGYSFGSELAYDALDQEMVFYSGGFISSVGSYEVTTDTWVLNSSGFWWNVTTSSVGTSCYPGIGCFATYPLGSGFGTMSWDGQLNGLVLEGGVDQYGYASDQTYVFYGGYWYAFWEFNINMTAPPVSSFAAMPTNSSAVAPVMIGGNCGFNQTALDFPNESGALVCASDSWVFEIPPEPFIVSVTPTVTDYDAPITITAYNTLDSGSGPNLSIVFFWGFLALLGTPDYGAFLNFSTNVTYTTTGGIPYAATDLDVGVYEEDFFDVVGFNITFVTVENVTAAPSATPTITELDQAGVAEVNFTSDPTLGDAPYTFAWSFGTGQGTSTAQNPVYSYTAAGSFTVGLTVTDHAGQTFTTSFTETVYAVLTATGASNASGGADVGIPVSFTGTPGGGSGGDVYSWSFGNGGSAATQDGTFTYTTPGTYTVYFNVTDNLGYKVSGHFTQVVNPDLAAAPTASTSSPNTKTSVSFYAGTTGGTATFVYAWNFGDGGTSTSENPTHTFGTVGTYTVTLTVTDAFHLKVTKSLTETVSKAPATVLGLPATEGYGVIGAIVVLIVVGLLAALLMSRRRKKAEPMNAPPAAWNQGASGGTPPPTGASAPPAPPAGGSGTPPPSGSS